MNRRRMMMSGERKALVTISLSDEAALGTCVEYGGVQYRKGSFACKKGEVINCICFPAVSGTSAYIYVDGRCVVYSYVADVNYKLKVESDIYISADYEKMYVTTG